MEEHGGNIYDKEIELDFSVNVNPFGMPQTVKAAAYSGVEMGECYPDLYSRELRQKIGRKHSVSSERILVGNGASELIYAAAAAIRPKKGLVCGPAFSEYEKALCAAGSEVCHFFADRAEEFRVTEQFPAMVEREKPDMIFLCHPDNPTGRLFEKEILAELCRICRRNGIILAVDECFLDMTDPGEDASCLTLMGSMPELLVFRAFTKLYAMPGLRLGYAVAGSQIMAEKIRRHLPPWNVSLPAQMAGIAALEEQEFAGRTVEYLLKEKDRMARELEKAGFRVWHSDTVFLLFEGPLDLQERCLEKKIYIRDAASFRGISRGTYRIGMKKQEDNNRLLTVLRQIREEKE